MDQNLEELGDRLCEDIDRPIATMRAMQRSLYPTVLDHLGLDAAIDELVQDFQDRSGIACNLEMEGEPFELDIEKRHAVYRIVQEALTNVMRHAEAAEVDVALRREGRPCMSRSATTGGGWTRRQRSRRIRTGWRGCASGRRSATAT